MPGKAIGTVALVQPGVEVWSKTRVHVERGSTQPVGGLVLYVTEQLDGDTGELGRAFVCLDHTRTRPVLRWSMLPESQIDPHTAQAADLSTLVRLWRRLGEELAFKEGRQPRRGPATKEEARIADAIRVLVGLVFDADGPLYGVLAPPRPEKPADPRPDALPNVGALCD